MEVSNILKDRMAKLPALLSVSKGDFIKKIGITRSSYSSLINGKTSPSFKTCKLLLKEYPVNPYWFFFGHGNALISQESHQRMMLEHPESDQTLTGLQEQINELRKMMLDYTARLEALEKRS